MLSLLNFKDTVVFYEERSCDLHVKRVSMFAKCGVDLPLY